MSAPAPVRLITRTVTALLLSVRGVFAAAVAAALLAGLPYGLVRYIGWPLPHQVPSLHQLQTDITSPVLGDQVYLNALAIVIWLLWLLITVSFLLETIALLRGVELPPLPGLRPTQALAVILLTAIGLTALMARTAAPAQAAAAPEVPTRAPATVSAPASPGPAAATSAVVASTELNGPSLAHPAQTEHTVVPGDTLYAIAQADYGNGDDWKVLYTDNAGQPQPGGQSLTNPDLIRPGWVLHTTSPAAPAPAPAPSHSAPTPGQVTVPDQTAPAHESAPPARPAPAPTREQSAPAGQNTTGTPQPHSSTAAPAGTHPRSADTRSSGSEWIDLAEGGALAAAVLAALGLAVRRTRRLRRWYGTCYWPTPGQHPTEPLTMPIPLRPAHRPITTAGHDDQMELDEFSAPLTTTTFPTSVTWPEAVQVSTTHIDHQVPAPEPEKDEDRDEDEPTRIPAAVADGRILALQDLDPLLALTGPGALPAARALTAAALAATEHRRDGALLLLSRADAALLLECAPADLPATLHAVPDLELAETGGDAVTQLELHVAYRSRLLEENEATSLEETPDFDQDDFPPVILLAVARPDHAERITATLHAAAGLRVHAVLLGEHPGTPAWTVAGDGYLDGPGAPAQARMFHLPAQALSSALTLLGDATGTSLREAGTPVAPDPHGDLAAPEADLPAQPDHEQDADRAEAPASPHDDAGAEAIGDVLTTAPAVESGAHEPDADRDATLPSRPEPAEIAQVNAQHEASVEPVTDAPSRPGSGPLLLLAPAGPDRVAQITEEYAARPVRITVLGVRAITTPTGTIDARLRGDAWRAVMKMAVTGSAQHVTHFATLWPDHDDQLLRKTVKNAVYDMRKTLKQRCQDPAGNPGRYITHADHRYGLNEQTVAVDLTAFTALRALAAETRDLGERAAAATAALALYSGDLLTGEEEEWMIAPRTKARRDALATATLLAQLADRADDPESALTWWERALQIDDNEEVYRQILRAQLRLGRYADALATRDLLMLRLAADDLAPAPETMTILAQLHNRRPVPGQTRSAGQRAA